MFSSYSIFGFTYKLQNDFHVRGILYKVFMEFDNVNRFGRYQDYQHGHWID